MTPDVYVLPLFAEPPGIRSTPKGIYNPPNSQGLAKMLLKGMSPQLKGKLKGQRKAHKAVPRSLTIKR